MIMKFILIEDGGHGWLRVPRTLLKRLGIEKKITSYSYQKGSWVYLEEDQDASTFFYAYQKKFNKKPEYERQYDGDYSKVRNYQSYSAD